MASDIPEFKTIVFYKKRKLQNSLEIRIDLNTELSFNPNKAGLFEGSFLWGFNLIAKKNLANIYITLYNLFDVFLKWKNTDIIRYKLRPLVSLLQGNAKKIQKMIKLHESSERLEQFQ